MANEKRSSSGSQGARRRRPTPTIDLKATEVAAGPAASKPLEAAEAVEAATAPPAPAASPPNEGLPPPEPPKEPPRSSIAWLPPGLPWQTVGAGAAGGATVLLLFLLVWAVVPRAGDPPDTLSPRLATIEMQLRELAARPVPAGVDPQAIDALTTRLAKLEAALNAPRPAAADPALAGRIAALENALKPLNETATALTRRAEETETALRNMRSRADAMSATQAELQSAARTSSADHDELGKLADRIVALEKADRAVADQLAKSAAAAGSDRPVRLAVVTAALRAAVDRGDPYAAELASVQTLSNDTDALSALGPFAATGVPSTSALARELLVLLPVMQRTAGAPQRDGGFLERLQANAERLVRIRPIEEVAGEDVAAILLRTEVKAAHSDIAGALAELAKLPPAVRSPAFDWIAKVEGRAKAVEASRRLAANAVAALKTNP